MQLKWSNFLKHFISTTLEEIVAKQFSENFGYIIFTVVIPTSLSTLIGIPLFERLHTK